jgi:peroxiredoxin
MSDQAAVPENSLSAQINARHQQIDTLYKELNELRHREAAMPVQDYVLKDFAGNEVPLSAAFGDRDQLVLIHNMGFACPYCTLWADGFNGLFPYVQKRAAFVLVSNDSPEKQRLGAEKRGWKMPMLSCEGTTLFEDLGFTGESDSGGKGWWPGVSTLVKHSDGSLSRHSKAFFGPGDEFCSVWRFFDLLERNDDSIEAAPL